MDQKSIASRSEDKYIEVLFHEYETLRAEIISRTMAGFQVVAVGAAVLGWLAPKVLDAAFGKDASPQQLHWLLALVAVIVLAFLYIFKLTEGEIRKCGYRLNELEDEINYYAGRTLLRWEGYSSANATGWWWSRKRKNYPPPNEPPKRPSWVSDPPETEP